MSLKIDAFRSIKWSSASQFGKQLTQFLTMIVLANLLLPNEFGLITMAMVFIGFLEIFKDLGTGAFIVHSDNLSDELINNIYWINFCFGFLLAVIIFFCAPIIAIFFNNSALTNILRVLSITFIFSGASIVHKSLLEKDMKFNHLAKYELATTLLGSVTAIMMALFEYGVWSLVFQNIVISISLAMLYWMRSVWRPKFEFRIKNLAKVSNYSKYLVGYSIFNYFVRNFDYIIIGKVLGDRALGHYFLAYRIMLYPVQNISAVLSRVLFPVLSRLQHDNAKFVYAYTIATKSIALITFPLMMGLFVLSNEIASTFFIDDWNSEVLTTLIMILAPVGLIQTIASTTGPIYQAKGKTKWLFYWGLVTGIISIIAFSISVRWGIIGVAGSYLVITLLWNYHCFSIPFKLINLSTIKFFSQFGRITLTSLLMSICLLILKLTIPELFSPIFRLVILVISGIVLYFGISYLIHKSGLMTIKEFLSNK